ncbi:MAG: hypothetical protein ABF876_19045, partial [Acetobacter aceti]
DRRGYAATHPLRRAAGAGAGFRLVCLMLVMLSFDLFLIAAPGLPCVCPHSPQAGETSMIAATRMGKSALWRKISR